MNYVSTDVDRILEYIKGREKAELIEVSRALGMKPMEVDKWAKILEKQGLLSIQYDITKMYLVYKEAQARPDAVDKYIEELEKKQLSKERESQRAILSGILKPNKEETAEPVKKPHNVGIEPTKKKDSGFLHGGAFNLFIFGKKSDLKMPPDATVQKENSALKMTQKALIPAQTTQKKSEEKKAKKDIAPDTGMQKTSHASQMLKGKVDAINATVAEIAHLKAEKEKLYATEYVPLISRFDLQLSTLGSKLSEKEDSLSALKKRIVELPDAVAKLDNEMQESLQHIRKIEDEYRRQLESLSQLRLALSKSREEIKSDIAYSKNSINVCMSSLKSIEEGIASTSLIKDQAVQRIKEANQKIEEERKIIEKMAALIDGSQIQVAELQELVSTIQNKVRQADSTISSLEASRKKLGDAERSLNSLETSYQQKFSEVRKFAQYYETEINALRNEIERGYVNRYLAELKKLSQEQERTALELSRKDEDIELKMKSARERLQQLIKESRALSKKFEEDI